MKNATKGDVLTTQTSLFTAYYVQKVQDILW